MPEPFSSKIGLGMNVAVFPACLAVFLTTYLCNWSASAISSSGRKRRSISPWPGPPTSWWWLSVRMPSASSTKTIVPRRSLSVSLGGAGK